MSVSLEERLMLQFGDAHGGSYTLKRPLQPTTIGGLESRDRDSRKHAEALKGAQ